MFKAAANNSKQKVSRSAQKVLNKLNTIKTDEGSWRPFSLLGSIADSTVSADVHVQDMHIQDKGRQRVDLADIRIGRRLRGHVPSRWFV